MSINLPKAILLDMDDTILEYGTADGCWREVCEAASSRIRPVTSSDLLAAILESRDWFWSEPVRNRNGRLDLPWARRQVVTTVFEQLGMDRGIGG